MEAGASRIPGLKRKPKRGGAYVDDLEAPFNFSRKETRFVRLRSPLMHLWWLLSTQS